LLNLQRGRSSLSIAHRLSTIASADLILVLKDGQVIEQGNHKELLALDGVFATMWADQISTNGDVPASVSGQSLGKEAVVGYLEDQHGQAHSVAEVKAPTEDEGLAAPQDFSAGVLVDTPEGGSIAPTDNHEQAPPVPVKEAPIAFPTEQETPEATTAAPAPAPLAFPTSDDTASERPQSVKIPSQIGGVTFGETVNSPPSRGETPDPGSEQKRKRISSQNLQKFARKMSLATRRVGSSNSAPREGSQDAGTSTPLTSDDVPSATASVDDADKKDKRKEKKEKRRTLF